MHQPLGPRGLQQREEEKKKEQKTPRPPARTSPVFFRGRLELLEHGLCKDLAYGRRVEGGVWEFGDGGGGLGIVGGEELVFFFGGGAGDWAEGFGDGGRGLANW